MKIEQFNRTHHSLEGNYDGHRLSCARYKNSSGFALAVVASLRFTSDGELGDWSAYWGGCDKTQREEDAVRWVAKHGCKLSGKDAGYFFPNLPLDYYRP